MRILLGISGSIAAYKTAHLTRLWVKQSAEVRVLMTPAATEFISPLTLSTLSKNPVLTEVQSESGWNNHVELGLWADALVIAPATANTLARLANGICDSILSAVFLSARCPVFVAPAMDLDMWKHPATQHNIQRLQQFGTRIIPVGVGELASGLIGEGRMAEPEEIISFVTEALRSPSPQQPLTGKRALVTAGPTQEPIDPVRFIGNNSSGKMGVAIAEELARQGAQVTLVLGPSTLVPSPALDTIRVQTASEMHSACSAIFQKMDIAVFAAAVADYRPKTVATQKIKKTGAEMQIDLVPNVDIAASLGQQKQAHQLTVGFALETNEEEQNALNKLQRKGFDFIVLNSTRDAQATFGFDTNKITILAPDGSKKAFPLKSKLDVAKDIVEEIYIRSANR